MSREARKGYYNRDWDRNRDRDRDRERDRDRDRVTSVRDRERSDYRSRPPLRKRSRSPTRRDEHKRSRSPRKPDKDILDENILSEISKLPEPSELWDNQFQEGGFSAPPPPAFSQPPPEGVATTSYGGNYQPSYSGIYDDFPSVGSVPQPPQPPHPPDIASWNQMSLPPPPPAQAPPQPPAPFLNNVEDQIKKEAAIESEMRHQKAALSKQREDYVKKANILKKELDTLKDQRNELRGDAKRSPSPDTKRFLKENTKLQLEIQNKLKTIYNVVDMLNGIIGEEAPVELHDSDDSAERGSKRKSRSPSANKKFNYIYYDPEMHWCRVCNEFPPTAKEYLNHLHSPAHHKMAAAHMEAPWHTVSGMNEGFPSYPQAQTKRTPIKGLQFFVPSTAWYCKLCDQFIGDLHCASAHLKSVTHSKNYTNFVEQNPHWETDWMSDRQKAFEKSRANKSKSDGEKPQQYMSHTITFNKDGFHTKRKNSPSAPEEKKKKKEKKSKKKRKTSSSSSSSSDSSSSDSEPTKKKEKKSKNRDTPRDDKTLTEWVSNIQVDRLNESDRKLLDSLKNRIKKDNDEKRRSQERDRSTRDRDRLVELQRKLRDSERRSSRSREEREGRSGREGREGRESREGREGRESRERRRRASSRSRRSEDREATPPPSDAKKPTAEVKKMPFIGKMPVFKNLSKATKVEEQKKEDLKKKEEEEEVTKKRREEMDAEIQKKVAEFKEKIARAQLEREQAQVTEQLAAALGPNPGAGLLPNPYLPAPALAAPTALGQGPPAAPPLAPPLAPALAGPPPPQAPQPQPQMPPQPNLPKDFQDALDIIFPSEVKNQELTQQELFAMPPGFMPGLMPPFPPIPLMQPQMFGFDMNAPLFQPRPQLYDTHVPIVPSPKPRHQQQKRQQKNEIKKKEPQKPPQPKMTKDEKGNGEIERKKEEMDDLAMLGIDASDVGAFI